MTATPFISPPPTLLIDFCHGNLLLLTLFKFLFSLLWVIEKIKLILMGCSGSKSDDTALVIRCRERTGLIRAAADQRFSLAAAHLAYFRSLKDVGEALRKFVEEEIVFATSSSSSSSSPAINLHSLDDEEEEVEKASVNSKHTHKHKHKHMNKKANTSSNARDLHTDHVHLDLSSSSTSVEDEDEFHNHVHEHDDVVVDNRGHGYGDVPRYGRYDDGDAMRVGGGGEAISPFAHRDFWEQPFLGNNPNNPYPYSYPYGMNQPPLPPQNPPQGYWGGGGGGYFGLYPPSNQGWGMPYGNENSNVYYMKASSAIRTVVQESDSRANGYTTSYWNSPDQNGGFLGYPLGEPRSGEKGSGQGKLSTPVEPPPPPSPKASVWDFINPFDADDSRYQGYYSQGGYGYGYGYGSVVSSPDSDEVREREGIPKLEEETETEVVREEPKWKKPSEEMRGSFREGSGSGARSVPLHKSEVRSKEMPSQPSSEGNMRSARSGASHKTDSISRGMPSHLSSEGSTKPVKQIPERRSSEESPMEMPSHIGKGSAISGSSHYHDDSSVSLSSEENEDTGSIHHLPEEKSSSDPTLVKSMDDGYVKKKGVTFEIDDTSKHDFDSSKLSSLTAISVHGTRDLREVVAEIRDDFEAASNYGKEVALMLEVGKMPYQPGFIKDILSRIMHLVAPSSSVSHGRSLQSVKLASKTLKLAKIFFSDFGQDSSMQHYNLSSTLDELYAWEKKLYKEVKDEERLRIIYEKQCKRLKLLDQHGAETKKIEATQASIRKLQTKLSISIKAIDAISSRIHKLRDEVLQPRVVELIHGLIRMWKSMLKVHHKQFQAIMESKMRSLKANTSFERESRVRATLELQRELLSWCSCFNDWISTQKSYVESLNGWLMRCLDYKPEETPDGPVPFSPGRLGAPPVFVICHDWNQAMEAISEARVADAMHTFASILGEMWDKQDEEHRQRVKAEYLSKDFKQRTKTLNTEKGKTARDNDAMSDKTGASIVASDTGVSQLDDLKVDLDSLRKRLGEEKAKHKDTVKIVHDAASTSIQGGLVPIFQALENFTSEALKAHEQVRLQSDGKTQ